MSDFAPITLQIIDNNNHHLFGRSVPFSFEINARQVLEQAFVLAQTTARPDPFLFTLEYFGYSEIAQFPGFLGYEIVSIAGLANNDQFFWDLLINGVSSSTGADTTFPAPGSTVTWRYTAVPGHETALAPRTSAILARRAARATRT